MARIRTRRRNQLYPNGWLLLAGFLLCLIACPGHGSNQSAQILPPPAEISDSVDVDALIKVLEDPAVRQRLIDQLKMLSDTPSHGAVQAKPNEHTTVHAAAAEILQSLSEDALSLAERALLPLVQVANRSPTALHWMHQQIANPLMRARWVQLLISLATILGFGYIVFAVSQRVLARSKRRFVSHRVPQSRLACLSALAFILALDLFAVALFAVAAYLALNLVGPTVEIRVVALAWIAAATAVRTLMAVTRFLFAPDAPELRLWPLRDEMANHAMTWARRLSIVSIYGYVTLEAAMMLGLPQSLFGALLGLLGILVCTLILVLIWQSRERVANFMRGTRQLPKGSPFHTLRDRVAGLWHLLGGAYVILLFGIWLLRIPGGLQFIAKASVLTLLVVFVVSLALRLLAEVCRHAVRLSTHLNVRFPGIEGRVDRYFPLLHAGARWIIYALAVIGALESWGVDSWWLLVSDPARVLAGTLGTVLLMVILAIAIWELTNSLIDKKLRSVDTDSTRQMASARVKTLLAVGRNAAFATITVVTLLLVLSELGINIAPLLAGAGVVGLAVAFGAQTLVKDIITGAIILFQDLVAVGEVVKVGDTAGLVEAISIRHIRLRDLSGTVHTVPFSEISTISNLTKDFSFYVFDIGIAYREDVDRVMEALKDLGDELQRDPDFATLILAPLEIFGLDRFADSAIIIKARIKTLPIQQWTIGREFNRRLKRRFDELGIEIPFPHRTLYFGVDRQGGAPPARVQLAGGVSVPVSTAELLHAGERAIARQQELSGLTNTNA